MQQMKKNGQLRNDQVVVIASIGDQDVGICHSGERTGRPRQIARRSSIAFASADAQEALTLWDGLAGSIEQRIGTGSLAVNCIQDEAARSSVARRRRSVAQVGEIAQGLDRIVNDELREIGIASRNASVVGVAVGPLVR